MLDTHFGFGHRITKESDQNQHVRLVFSSVTSDENQFLRGHRGLLYMEQDLELIGCHYTNIFIVK